MNYKPGTTVPKTGIYWCTVCKSPESFRTGDRFPECKNLCGRGLWQIAGQPQTQSQPQN